MSEQAKKEQRKVETWIQIQQNQANHKEVDNLRPNKMNKTNFD